MFKRLLPAAVIGLLFLVTVNPGCTKLDTTTLGDDLIPAIDNVNTFADTFDIETSQHIFNDTFKITSAVNNVLGSINNDALFGSTRANMYFQMKPPSFPYYFGNAKDVIIGLDSVVLCLNYTGFWGDSNNVIQKLQVSSINDENFAFNPTTYRTINYKPVQFPTPISPVVDVDIRKMKDTVKLRGDSVTNQIRIKLNTDFATELFNRDSIEASLLNNAFRTDTLFRKFYNGFAVNTIGGTGNALMYINLTDSRTKLQFYYRKKAENSTIIDTVSSYFNIITSDFTLNRVSATSNFIEKAYSSAVTSTAPSPYLHMITGPGTYANLKIPALDTLSNKIVHRAEIYMEQAPDDYTQDSLFSPPAYMYLDLVDTTTSIPKWKALYFDLNPNESYDPDYLKPFFPYYPLTGGVDHAYFGGYARKKINHLGKKVTFYTMNITRYVQQKVTKSGTLNYTMRLFPAYTFSYPQHTANISTFLSYNNPLAFGRVRLNSGEHPDSNSKMRMIVIWSKLNP